MFCRSRQNLVEQDDADPDHSADSDQAPIDVGSDDPLGQGGNQTGLRRWQRMWAQLGARSADESIRMINQIEHRRNNERTCDHAENQRDLLLPWRRINELTGFEVLQVVIRDRGDIENYRRRKKRERH